MGIAYRRGWIGKERDRESGLGDFGVKKYEYEYGRFLQPEPLWEKFVGWSVYQYGMNNPLRLSDGSGLGPDGVGLRVEVQQRMLGGDETEIGAMPLAEGSFSLFKIEVPPWVEFAARFVGIREIPGNEHNQLILEFFSSVHGQWQSDETPWCSAFLNFVMQQTGYGGTHSARALSWWNWGRPLPAPVMGALYVEDRGDGRGHVGIIVGKTKQGQLVVLGGNQGDAVNFMVIDTSGKDVKFRYPTRYHDRDTLPILPLRRQGRYFDRIPGFYEGREQ